MRRFYTFLAAVLITANVLAQAPQKMSFQYVIRNSLNKLVTFKTIGMRISILQGSATGTPIYVEIQTPSSNANGLVMIEVGAGTVVTGDFSTIDWSAGPYYIKAESDPAGGTNYSITSTSQLLSVPYAFYSSKAGNGFSGNYNDLTNKPAVFDGTWASLTGKPTFATVAFSGSFNDLINKPTIFDGTWASLTGKPTFATVATSGSYTDLLNKPKLFDSSWTAIKGKPTFATVAMTGSYTDLINKPILFDSLWTSIKGKPANIVNLAGPPHKGNMIFYTGTIWDTIPKGNNGQVLTLETGIPKWKNMPVTSPAHHVGDSYGGGIVFYVDSTGQHGFIVSIVDISAGSAWSNILVTIGATAESTWDGNSNTIAIISQSGHTSSAAQFCRIYNGGSFSDWYLPSIDQMIKLNIVKFEIDKTVGTTNVLNNSYWSSTELASGNAYVFNFQNGSFANNTKSTLYRVRAIRNF